MDFISKPRKGNTIWGGKKPLLVGATGWGLGEVEDRERVCLFKAD